MDDDVLKAHFERYDEGFYKFCEKELARVNTFFAGRTWVLLCGSFRLLFIIRNEEGKQVIHFFYIRVTQFLLSLVILTKFIF